MTRKNLTFSPVFRRNLTRVVGLFGLAFSICNVCLSTHKETSASEEKHGGNKII